MSEAPSAVWPSLQAATAGGVALELPDMLRPAMAGFNLHAQALGTAQLTATYQRR